MPTLTGLVNIFGFGVTLRSGDLFDSAMNGRPITINTHSYTVDSVQDANNLTLTSATEIAENVPYSCTVPDPPPPDPEPLTIGCFCPGDTNVAGCVVQSLVWHIEITNTSSPRGHSAIGTAILTCPGGGFEFVQNTSSNSKVVQDIALPLNLFYPNWSGINLTYDGNSSLLQIPADSGAFCHFDSYILINYLCLMPGGGSEIVSVRATPSLGCFADRPPFCRIEGGGGTATYTLFISTTLSGSECACSGGGMSPDPTKSTLNAADIGEWCLCVSGGTPPYFFALIAGQLPCGQSINNDTGCITGTPDGSCPGSATFTFRVTDSAGKTADVTCNLAEGCPGLDPTLGNWAA